MLDGLDTEDTHILIWKPHSVFCAAQSVAAHSGQIFFYAPSNAAMLFS